MDLAEQDDLFSSTAVEKSSCNKATTLKLHNTQKKLLKRIRELEDEVSKWMSTKDAPDVADILKDSHCSCAFCKDGHVQCYCSSCRPVEESSKESADSDEETGDGDGPFVKQDPQYIVLYRVFCLHNMVYTRRLYLDQPKFARIKASRSTCLVGEEEILNEDEFLERRPSVAMIVYRDINCFGVENEPSDQLFWQDSESIHIVHDELHKALVKLATSTGLIWPFNLSMSGKSDRNMKAPYPFFFHYRSALEKYALYTSETTHKHIRLVLDYIQSHYADDYKEAEEMFSRERVTSHHLPKLFRPGDMLISVRPNILAYECDGWLQDEKIHVWSYQFDGSFQKKKDFKSVVIGKERSIKELSIYPLKYAEVGMEQRLRDRGEQFWRCRRKRYVDYSGWDHKGERHYDTRFMIDLAMYREMHPDAPFFKDKLTVSKQETDLDSHLEGDSRLLFPPNIFGYNMVDKEWVDLSVENMSDVVWNKTAFDRLVLKTRTKDMIQALVSVHISMSGTTDIIDGKGNGLIILLHGGPGTGKTLTAESVAELAEKPLYRVTCGDIGTDSAGIEDYLRTVLLIGKIWDCVVLFDEADVFLEERSLADFHRNALVSVFLRVLEYYEGILILTSNRVGHFDEAFKSRIQLSLHYPSLVESDRRKIWRVFIRRLRELPESKDGEAGERVDVDDLEDHLAELASYKLNGRQIRNAVATARQMAKFKKETLEFTHLQTVIEIAREFDDYLVQAHGQSDEQWAKELGARA